MELSQITGCNLYAQGRAFGQILAEVELPETKHKTIEHKAADGLGTPKLPGNLEAMTAKLKMNGLYAEFHALTVDKRQMLRLQIRGNMRRRRGAGNMEDVPAIVHMSGWCSSRKPGTWKGGEGGHSEYQMEVWYYKLVIDGEEIEEVDVENHVHRAMGVDLTADERENLGK